MREKTFASFTGKKTDPVLSSLIFNLSAQQKESWPQLSSAIDALDQIRTRDLHDNGLFIKLQFNPARIISTNASIDRESIKKRPCFLCIENLPSEQKGILYRRHFLILCNPFPIIKHHYTVSHVTHTPQSLSVHIASFLRLAEDLSPDFSVFYNGPRAGASAPDHLHFQMMPAGSLPIEEELRENHNKRFIKALEGTSLFTMECPGREVLIVEGKTMNGISIVINTILDGLKTAIASSDEPIVNLLCSHCDNTWRLVLFLRRKHRPDVYYMKGEGRILISPGLVEMAGLVITPVEKDFVSVDAGMMKNIYREVSLPPELLRKVVDAL